MGTPMFAVKILSEINKYHEVLMVITQPDQRISASKTMVPLVKTWAVEHHLLVKQPENIRDMINEIMSMDVDLIVTAAYGQFIPLQILNHPKYQSINVHGSLLPKYRGGAPIQRAIINGEKETGISIIRMTKKMDAGAILATNAIPILDSDNQDSLFEKLSDLGSKMILPVIEHIKSQNIVETPQKEEEVSFAFNLTRADERIDFHKPARDCFNQIRGLCSNPGAFFQLDGLNIKVYNSIESDCTTEKKPSVLIAKSKDSFQVSCGNQTVLSILEVQLPGGKRMLARDFLNGKGKQLIVIDKEII